jgi:hypothetical protein
VKTRTALNYGNSLENNEFLDVFVISYNRPRQHCLKLTENGTVLLSHSRLNNLCSWQSVIERYPDNPYTPNGLLYGV